MNYGRKCLLLLSMLLWGWSSTMQGQPGSCDDYSYIINVGDTNSVTITKYTGPGGAMTIPTHIHGLLVTSIGSNAFGENSSPIPPANSQNTLTSVVIPGCVTNIGDRAFALCGAMTNVTLAYGLASIGEAAFYRCVMLAKITIPSSVTSIGDGAFYYCASLPSVTIPAGITNIGSGTFYSCESLTNVTILPGVTSLGSNAFEFCNFGSVTIPGSVTSIGGGAFFGCGLTNVTIDAGVTNIESGAFSSCVDLTSAYFMGNAPTADSGVFSSGTTLYSGGIQIAFPDDPVTVFYLPGTAGWSNSFAGRPTVPCIPNSLYVTITPAPAIRRWGAVAN